MANAPKRPGAYEIRTVNIALVLKRAAKRKGGK